MKAITFSTAILCSTAGLVLGSDQASVHHHHPGSLVHRHPAPVVRGAEAFGFTLGAAWDSRYVLEGRDQLAGDSILSAEAEATVVFDPLRMTLGAWYGFNPEGRYDEFNTWVDLGVERGEFEFYVGYMHLRFPEDGGHDHEVGAGVASSWMPWGLEAALDGYYSFAADGWFGEFSLVRGFEVHRCVSLEPGLVLGYNGGYVADGHDGWNHLAAVLAVNLDAGAGIEWSAYAAYNLAIDSEPQLHPDDFLLKNFFYAGVGLSYSF